MMSPMSFYFLSEIAIRVLCLMTSVWWSVLGRSVHFLLPTMLTLGLDIMSPILSPLINIWRGYQYEVMNIEVKSATVLFRYWRHPPEKGKVLDHMLFYN